MKRLASALAALCVLAALAGLAWSCSGSPPPPPSGEAGRALAATPPQASPTPEAASAAPPAPEPTPAPKEEPKSEPAPPPAARPAPPASRIEVAATKPGLTRIGADKCKMCHKPEYASWEASAHAKQDPPLDCESCHGPGSEYKALAVMKDPAKAQAAGLVIPAASFCTAKCHTKGWRDDFLKTVHAHKAAGAS